MLWLLCQDLSAVLQLLLHKYLPILSILSFASSYHFPYYFLITFLKQHILKFPPLPKSPRNHLSCPLFTCRLPQVFTESQTWRRNWRLGTYKTLSPYTEISGSSHLSTAIHLQSDTFQGRKKNDPSLPPSIPACLMLTVIILSELVNS